MEEDKVQKSVVEPSQTPEQAKGKKLTNNKIIFIVAGIITAVLIIIGVILLLSNNAETNLRATNYSPGKQMQNGQISNQNQTASPTPTPISLSSVPIYQQMLSKDKANYDYAISKDAEFLPTTDQRSFFMYWKPDGWENKKTRKLIVNLSGHGVYVTQGFSDWYKILTDKNEFAIASIQWWDGEGEKYQDYYTPEEIMTEVNNFLSVQGFSANDLIVLHGFSRGSANSYAVSAIDASGNKYFDYNIANAGSISLDFPPNVDIQNGKYGAKPLSQTRWILFCGGKDTATDLSGCPGMEKAKVWIEKYGGAVILFIKDPTGDHGSFMKKPENAKKVFNFILSQ